jgi:hypothetical protein
VLRAENRRAALGTALPGGCRIGRLCRGVAERRRARSGKEAFLIDERGEIVSPRRGATVGGLYKAGIPQSR